MGFVNIGVPRPAPVAVPHHRGVLVAEFAPPRAATVADLDEIALGAVVVAQPEPPADARPPASGNTRSPPGARPVRHARYVRLPGEKASLPGEKASLPGEKASLPGEKASLPGKKASLPGKKASLFGKKTSLPGKKTSLFGEKTSLFGKKTSLFGKKTSLFGARL
jgi:hypothetical protein